MSILSALLGVMGIPRILAGDLNVSESAPAGTVLASYTLENDGDIITETAAGGAVDAGNWITPKGAAGGDYEVRATITGGALSTGTTGIYQALSSNRAWTCQRSTVGTTTATLVMSIRRVSDSVELANYTVILTATRT